MARGRPRAEIARASGDRNQALADLEELLAGEADEELAKDARLALAKLYEHHVKEPARALSLIDQGVAEEEPARSRRRRRLEHKIQRQTQAQLFGGRAAIVRKA